MTNPCNHTPDPLQLLTVEEAARLLAVSQKTIRRLVARRQLPHLRVGRAIRLRRRELAAWQASHRIGAVTTSTGVR